MPKPSDIEQLDRRVYRGRLGWLLMAALGAFLLILYFHPEWVGAGPGRPGGRKWHTLWLTTAVLCICLGPYFFIRYGRWWRRLKRIATTQPARPMKMKLGMESGEDGYRYNAWLNPVKSGAVDDYEWRVGLWLAPSRLESQLGRQFDAQVFFDPESGKPAVIDYEKGTLWAWGGSRSVEKFTP